MEQGQYGSGLFELLDTVPSNIDTMTLEGEDTPAIIYRMKISAFNGSGESGYSNIDTISVGSWGSQCGQ